MKITNVKKTTCFLITTDEEYPNGYTRFGKDSWTVTIGESEEQVYDTEKLEKLFWEYIGEAEI